MRALSGFLLLSILVAACDRKEPTSTAAPAPSPAPAPAPSALQPPIRDNSSKSDANGGVVVEIRALVSTIASGEPARFAMRLLPEVAQAKDAPWSRERLDWSKAVQGLEFRIRAPDRKLHVLTVGETNARPYDSPIASFVAILSISDTGLGSWSWSKPAPKLLHAPGKYTFAVSGRLATRERSLSIASKPIELEVKPHGDERKTIAELEQLAAAEVEKRRGLSSPPKPSARTVEDVEGNLWLRFTLRERAHGRPPTPEGASQVDVVEVLMDPAGKVLFVDEYEHFACVAEGTRIATPSGDVRVETLRPGDTVIGYDVQAHRPTTTHVLGIASSHAESLYAVGSLELTGEHPVFAGGRWLRAADLPAQVDVTTPFGNRARTSRQIERATTVYDLTVGPPHTYFAEGVLVHNKIAAVPIGGNGQPFDGLFFRRAARKLR